ncbi:MAG: hypothetical protein KA754_04555 [Corallincola sp.]|nr:hypothetical protein [Corallincola sp.]
MNQAARLAHGRCQQLLLAALLLAPAAVQAQELAPANSWRQQADQVYQAVSHELNLLRTNLVVAPSVADT